MAKKPMPVDLFPPSEPNPVGSFSGRPAAYPQQDPSAYTNPGSPFNPDAFVKMPVDGSVKPYDPQLANISRAQKSLGYAMPFEGGIGAGSQVTPTTDAGDATLQTVGSGIAGAASGAASGAMIGAAGGPIGAGAGAVIGGLTGLVTGGLQSFLGLRSARDQKRKQERLAREINARADRRYAQERADALEQKSYDRRNAALQSQWAAMQEAGRRMNELMTRDENLKQLFIAQGR